MWLEILLFGWTGLAAIWWVVSYYLVAQPSSSFLENSDERFISIFKPLPKIYSDQVKGQIRQALLSFVAQEDDRCEILFGVPHQDAELWSVDFSTWKKQYPRMILKIINQSEDAKPFCPNPKIAWQYVLAPYAVGELWLWSDADIVVPPGYFARLRREITAARLVTSPYVIRRVQRLSDLPDALFVNVEFYPGARLLGRRVLSCAFGAGMLFASKDFHHAVEWQELGSALADDFLMGNRLQPACLGGDTVETFSTSPNLRHAVAHYLRWQKTVRWCRPGGFAAQIFILPVLGWLAGLVLEPSVWSGLGLVLILESLWAALLFRRVGCRLPVWVYFTLPFWSLGRALAWLICWLPWRVRWGSQSWSHS